MKRSYFGLGLLAFLLAASLTVTWVMSKIHGPIAQALMAAEERAQQRDWEGAAELEGIAAAEWDKWQALRNCFADHTPTEEVDAQFAMLSACIRSAQWEAFPSLAAQTAQMITAIGDAHSLRWSSFF